MRLQHLFARARRGEPLTIGVIGGSITQGASATQPEWRYGNRVTAWWHERFPKADVRLVNAGIGGWFDQVWGGYRQTREMARHLPEGKHRVRFELLAEKHPQSNGHEFRILGLGAAGVRSR